MGLIGLIGLGVRAAVQPVESPTTNSSAPSTPASVDGMEGQSRWSNWVKGSGPTTKVDPKSVPDSYWDGAIVGAENTPLPGNARLGDVRGLQPPPNVPPQGQIVFINGMNTTLDEQRETMQEIAGAGFEVIGVHNATEGVMRDGIQALGDKFGVMHNKAVETTTRLLYETVTASPPVQRQFVGHSQGALILSRSLKQVEAQLRREGKSEDDIRKMFGRVEVQTLGGASFDFPPGVRATHFINDSDPIPGVIAANSQRSGAGAEFVRFGRTKLPNAHTDNALSKYHDAQLYVRFAYGGQEG
jgi:hypothetical protein